MNQFLDFLRAKIAERHAAGQKFRVTDFLWAIVALEQMAIDTAEERAAIDKYVMDEYDKLVLNPGEVPGSFAARTREFVKESLDDALLAASKFKPAASKPAASK